MKYSYPGIMVSAGMELLPIGSHLCAEFIKLHHGRIWVESSPGKGSTFFFSIPLK